MERFTYARGAGRFVRQGALIRHTYTPSQRIGGALACAAFSLALLPGVAQADTVADAQSQLSSAEAQMSSIVDQYNATKSQADQLQQQIDETTQTAADAQAAVLEGREELSKDAVAHYRGNESSQLLTLLLSADNVNDLFENMHYIEMIMQDTSDKINEQKARVDTYNDALSKLNGQRDQLQSQLDTLDGQRSQAQAIVDAASANLKNAQGEEAARLAALQQQAERVSEDATQNDSDVSISPEWNTGNHEEADDQASGGSSDSSASSGQSSSGANANPNAGSKQNASSNANSGSNTSNNASSNTSKNNGSSSADSSTGWKSGSASAYGGSTDPSTPNPGYTATGAICNDSSMGVAVPMSMPGYRSLLGRSVEIKYNGKTVIARINDCGSMGGGSRVLDLQPGVFKALGFSSCQAWGVRTVQYRIL